MTKAIQNNIAISVGLIFFAQSILAPAASAAGLLGDNRAIYWQAATSAEPIIFDGPEDAAVAIKVIEHASAGQTVSVDGNNSDSEPTVEEVKAYVLNEVKKAGLSVSEAQSLIYCESRWDYKAVNNRNRNGSNDKGLWQINSIHKNITDAEKLDYKASTKWAIAKRLNDGSWSAWSCAKKRVAAKPVPIEPVWE